MYLVDLANLKPRMNFVVILLFLQTSLIKMPVAFLLCGEDLNLQCICHFLDSGIPKGA